MDESVPLQQTPPLSHRSLERPLTASQLPFPPGVYTAPVVDYEPPPVDAAKSPPPCPAPAPAALHRPSPRSLRPAERKPLEAPVPPAASAFADAALRRVLEVVDRRRPIAQLHPLLSPAVLDMVYTMARTAGPQKAAVLRRVRLRAAAVDERDPRCPMAAEVFASYTRGQRVRAIAGRIELREGRWRMVALQIG